MIFFYPEKPMRIRKIEDVPEGYFVEVKKNGHRIEILCEDNELKLLSREGTPLKAGKNFNWEWLKDVFPQPFYLDGECIGARQKGDVSDTIVIWDAIIRKSCEKIL
jgi:ATP-dependent DNA ligase